MSETPMDFENANLHNLQTWKKVCKLIAVSSVAGAALLLFLALVLI